MSKCRICSNEAKEIMNFGRMPMANGFIAKADDQEHFYEMAADESPFNDGLDTYYGN